MGIGFNSVILEMYLLSIAIPVVGLVGIYVKNRWFSSDCSQETENT